MRRRNAPIARKDLRALARIIASHNPAHSAAQRRLFGAALGIKRKRGKARRRALRGVGTAVRRLVHLPTSTLRAFARKNPTGYVYSGPFYRPGEFHGHRGQRFYRRPSARWADVQTRDAFYPGSGKPRRGRNPLLQIVGMPARLLTNPLGLGLADLLAGAAGGAAFAAGYGGVSRLLQKKNPRSKRRR